MTGSRAVLAVMDLDGTVVGSETVKLFFWRRLWRYPKSQLPRLAFGSIAKKLGISHRHDLRLLCLESLRGLRSNEIDVIGRRFARLVTERFTRRVAVDRIAWHRRRRDTVLLATGAPAFYARHIADILGFDDVVATEIAFDSEQRFQGILDGSDCVGEEKARRVLSIASATGFTTGQIAFYADSAVDAPLLRQVGQPVAVCPEPALATLCVRHGWPSENWRSGKRAVERLSALRACFSNQ